MEIMDENLEATLRYLGKKLKDWRESTLNVVKEIFILIMMVNDLEPCPYTKKTYLLTLPLILDKIGDAKYNDQLYKIMLRYTEWVFPKFIIV